MNVAREAGVLFGHENGAFGEKWLPETLGSGVALFDYDGDSLPDLLLVNSTTWPGHAGERGRPTPRLYRNAGDGTFEDVTERAGLAIPVYGMGAAAADFDADGDTDIYLTALGPNLLLENDRGVFRDVSASVGLSGPDPGASSRWSTAAAWVDVDRDGWLDLFVCNYVRWSPDTDVFDSYDGVTKAYAVPDKYDGESCRLYGNESGVAFSDRTVDAGLYNRGGKSLGVAVDDLNDDGWPDLVVANDLTRNFLYMNQGDGTFIDMAVSAGVAYDENGGTRSGMGIDIAELTTTGRPTIAIGNFSHETVALFARDGQGAYRDLATAAGIAGPTLLPLTFGLTFADMDLDGTLDLLLANGHIEPTIAAVMPELTFAQSPQLFMGAGGGGFTDASTRVGPDFAEAMVGRGLATADYDRDGDLDVFVTANGGAAKIFRNERTARPAHWVRVALQGTAPNLGAVGAVVTLWVGTRPQRRVVRTGGSYLSQSETNPMLFGLGSALGADSVTVRWPTTGATQTTGPLLSEETYVVVERPRREAPPPPR